MRRRVLILLAAAVRAEPVLDRAAIPMRPADWLAVRRVRRVRRGPAADRSPALVGSACHSA
jgi:hypothetical protein